VRRSLLAALLASLAAPAGADEVVLKLGTLAPQGSSWHLLLQDLGERFAEASGGTVRLRIYPGGTQGAEGDMVRKMAVGQLQAVTITNVGMRDIVPETGVFTTPGLVEDQAEFRAVLARVAPRLETLLEARGYVVLHWADVGPAYVFCTRGYRSPSEMGDTRVFVWGGDPAAVEAFRAVGFRPVPLSPVDLVPSLQTGMVSCVAQPLAYALTARTFEKANHLLDFPWGWMAGATLVRREAWERVPAGLRPRLLQAAREVGVRLDAESRKLHDDALAAMRRQGLVVFPVDAGAWRSAGERAWAVVRGAVVPPEFFDAVVRNRDELRRAGR